MMKILLTLAFLFFFGSLLGWVLELFFRRLFGDKKWVNPGFLRGPYLPIYGLGLDALFLLCRIDLSAIPFLSLQVFVRILIMGISMTLIEYIGGLIFVKGMKIKLWDYSDQWGNIQGIICPLFSLLWTAAGAAYYFLLDPFFYNSVIWLWDNLAFSFVVGFFFGLFAVDLASTLQMASRIKNFAEKHQIVVRYEKLKGDIQDALKESRKKVPFFRPFSVPSPLENFLKTYLFRETPNASAHKIDKRKDDKKEEYMPETNPQNKENAQQEKDDKQ